MGYQETQPTRTLSEFIEAYWLYENDSDVDDSIPIMPDGCMDIIFDLTSDDILVYGPATSAKTVTMNPGQRLFGIRFCPGMLPLFIKYPADVLQDAIVRLESVSHETHAKLARLDISGSPKATVTIVNTFFEEELSKLQAHPILRDLSTGLPSRDASVKALANRLGVSVRQLERVFRKYVGLTPKRFLKIHRFQSIRWGAKDRKSSYAELSAQYGYVDQSHMNKEYKQLAQTTPTNG
jgi:AraC-like DNA-binding protein